MKCQAHAEKWATNIINDTDLIRSKIGYIFSLKFIESSIFSINFFTSIGLGALTENMREYLANMPKI